MVYLTEKWHDFLQVQEVGRVRPPAATSWHLRVSSHLPRPSPGATKPKKKPKKKPIPRGSLPKFYKATVKQFPWTTTDKYVVTLKWPGAKLVATDNN